MCLHLNGTILSCHCEIDVRILILRAIGFFSTTAGSSLSRFLIVFLNKYYNAQQLGILLGVRPGISFVASFLWGYIGDCTQRHLLCLISGLVTSTILINGLTFPFIQQNFWYSFLLMNGVTLIGASGCLYDAIVILILSEKKDEQKKLKQADKDNNDEEDEDGGTKEYGATRLWGAVGWGLGSLICGTLLAQFGEDYLFWFYDVTYSIPIMIMIVSASYMSIKKRTHHDEPDEHDSNDEEPPEMIKNELLETPVASDMLSSPPQFQKGRSKPKKDGNSEKQQERKLQSAVFRKNVCTLYGFLFLSNLLIFGTCMAFVENYLFLFLLEEFHATTVLCGLTIGMMVLGEVPIFYYAKWLIDKIGIIGLLTLAHFAYVIRCVFYTLLPETPYYAWFILLIEPIHGVTFGGMWIASVEYGSKLAPRSMQATMQGLINGLYQGLAVCSGTIIGGVIYHHYGPVFMYRLSAAIIAGWMIFFQVSLRLIRMCDDSDGIRLIFSEKITKNGASSRRQSENVESLLNRSIAEAPKVSLLINDDASIQSPP